jgi:MinD-like ATPase involved in chromosome partitioning or flagellar assembly
MLLACWSVKGGSGTTVVAAALAVVLARSSSAGVLLVDAAGDLPAALGMVDPPGPGLADWLAAEDVSADALRRLAVAAAPGVELIPWLGGPAPPATDPDRLVAALATEHRSVVVDCGSSGGSLAMSVASSATLSLLVLRPCYLALRRALAAPIRPSGVILVNEPGRTLAREDVEDVLGVPVRAEVPWSDGVSRAVDAGVLGHRLPRALARSMKDAA